MNHLSLRRTFTSFCLPSAIMLWLLLLAASAVQAAQPAGFVSFDAPGATSTTP
jgi:hypothetical protein